MAKVLFKRKTTDEINQLEVEDGALIYNTDNGKTYMDFGDNRIQTGGNADTMIAIGGEEPTDTDIKLWFPYDIANLKYDKMYIRNPETNEWEEVFLPPNGDTYPIGMYGWFAGENAPTNWLRCDGQEISRTEYKELFNAIGTTYGDGDGSTTFNLPNVNLENRTLVGSSGDGEFSVGNTGGEKEHKLTTDEIPPLEAYAPLSTSGGNMAYLSNYNGYTGSGLGKIPITKTKTSEAVSHNNMQPYMASVCCIKAKQSIGLVGNVVPDINAQGDNDVAPTKVIKDYVDNKQTYSTDEIVVGTYLGKPLYRKVLTGKLPTGKGENTFNLSSECSIKRKYGRIKSMLGGIFELDVYYTPSIAYSISSWISADEHTLKVECGANYNTNSEYEITVEYTKTTDEVAE